MGKGLLLLSGGIDSPVAGYLALKQGAEVFAVHFPTVKITGKESIEKTKTLCKTLGIKKMFVVDTSEQFAEISTACEIRYYFVLTKRLMLRIGQELSQKNNIDFLVTGESLGQVSSQTLSNLSSIDSAVKIPVLRPLLGLEKVEIINIAQRIGTFEISKGKEICDALGPKHPATKTDLNAVIEEEKKIDVQKLIETAISGAQIYQP